MKSAHGQPSRNHYPSAPIQTNTEQALLETAIQCHQSGHIQQAIQYYQQVIELNPKNIDALQLLSTVAYSLQDYSLAENLIRKAIKANGKIAEFHKRLGDILSKQQLTVAAKNAYKKALKLMPQAPEAHNNLGLLYHNEGNYNKAIGHYKKAVHQKPDFAIAWNNYGNSLVSLQKYDIAISTYETAIGHSHHFSEPWCNLGNLFFQRKQLDKASQYYTKTIEINPQHINAYNNLGCVLQAQNQHAKALDKFEFVLAKDPSHIDTLRNAASASAHLGNFDKALNYFEQALKLDATHHSTLKAFSNLVKYISINSYQSNISQLIQNCFSIASIDHQALSKASAKLICLKHNIHEQAPTEDTIDTLINPLAEDTLLKDLLIFTVNEDIQVESLLKGLRKQICKNFHLKNTLTQNEQNLAICIALQMFNNEYVIDASDEETKHLLKFQNFQSSNDTNPGTRLNRFIVQSMYYAPLKFLTSDLFETLSNNKTNPHLNLLLHRTILNNENELRLCQQIPSFGNINNTTSIQVRQQYEENPYPRWLSLTIPDGDIQTSPVIESTDLPEGANILVAGCGTGKHPISLAIQHPQANIIAVDLSRRSLAYAKRMTQQYQCHNITFMHSDILALDDLNTSFALIESIGVLHHLHKPLDGWKKLLTHLDSNGIMKIALYSETARRMVAEARQKIISLGLSDNIDGIHSFRHYILSSPENTQLYPLTHTLDFFSTSGCRDLAFHRQEHRFTIPQLQESINILGLTFLGFDIQDAHTKHTYLNEHPNDEAFCNLENWHAFEQKHPDTFKSMYQFYVKKS